MRKLGKYCKYLESPNLYANNPNYRISITDRNKVDRGIANRLGLFIQFKAIFKVQKEVYDKISFVHNLWEM